MDQPPGPPPPSSPGGAGPDWGQMKDKLAAARGPDRLVLIAGLIFFIDSFLPWYGVRLLGTSFNASGWNSGGLAVISILLAIAATVVAVAGVTGMQLGSPASAATIGLALSAGAFVFALLRLVTETSFTKYGLFLAIALGAVMSYGSYQKYQASR